MASKWLSWDLNSGLTLKPKFLVLLEPVRPLGGGEEVADVIPPQLGQKVEMLQVL